MGLIFDPYSALLDQLTDEKYNLSKYAGPMINWTVAALETYPEGAAKCSDEEKPSQWAELGAMHLVLHFSLKKER